MRTTRRVADTGIFGANRPVLCLLCRRLLRRDICGDFLAWCKYDAARCTCGQKNTAGGWSGIADDTFEQALHLRTQPLAGDLALEVGDLVRRGIGAQMCQPRFVAATEVRDLGGRLRRFPPDLAAL